MNTYRYHRVNSCSRRTMLFSVGPGSASVIACTTNQFPTRILVVQARKPETGNLKKQLICKLMNSPARIFCYVVSILVELKMDSNNLRNWVKIDHQETNFLSFLCGNSQTWTTQSFWNFQVFLWWDLDIFWLAHIKNLINCVCYFYRHAYYQNIQQK